MKKIGVVSLGCSKNRIDSEIMMGYLNSAGYAFTNDPADADVIIVNTCGFIEAAKQESIDTILEMAQHKKNNCAALVVTGCLSQRYREELTAELPEVDFMLGVNEYEKLPALLDTFFNQTGCFDVHAKRVLTTPSHYAYLRIADGCDNRCTYCAIPFIRGNYVSRDMEEIICEAKYLVSIGVIELIVIAQDTTRYGLDRYGKRCLPQLLERLDKETDAVWIRLMYTYPDDIDDTLLDVILSSKKIVHYIDIPIQHADNNILLRMNRRGTNESLCRLMDTIRSRDKSFVLRTSFIVGFPGETQEHFSTLCKFIVDHPFDKVGVFAYSPEDGTKACTFDNAVDADIAAKRVKKLMMIQQKVSYALNERRIGTIVDVLIEGFDSEKSMYYGRSYAEAPEIDGYIYFRNTNSHAIGSFTRVKITKAREYDLIGEDIHEFGQ